MLAPSYQKLKDILSKYIDPKRILDQSIANPCLWNRCEFL